MSDDISQELRAFEGSEALANGDLSVCIRATDRIDAQAKRIAELEAALKRIEDTDPDEGTAWFHEVARAALEGGENG